MRLNLLCLVGATVRARTNRRARSAVYVATPHKVAKLAPRPAWNDARAGISGELAPKSPSAESLCHAPGQGAPSRQRLGVARGVVPKHQAQHHMIVSPQVPMREQPFMFRPRPEIAVLILSGHQSRRK